MTIHEIHDCLPEPIIFPVWYICPCDSCPGVVACYFYVSAAHVSETFLCFCSSLKIFYCGFHNSWKNTLCFLYVAIRVFFLPRADSSTFTVFTYLAQRSPLENMHLYNCPFVKHQTSAIFLTYVSVCWCQSTELTLSSLGSHSARVYAERHCGKSQAAFHVKFTFRSRHSLTVWDGRAPPSPHFGQRLSVRQLKMCRVVLRVNDSHQATTTHSWSSAKSVLLPRRHMITNFTLQ